VSASIVRPAERRRVGASLVGAEIIIDQLIEQRIPYLIGVSGHGVVGLMDVAYDRREQIETIAVHNEQVAGFMADAYYRVARRPVVAFTSCGPGALNISMPVATAMFDSSALMLITGNIPTQWVNRGSFQDIAFHYQADFINAIRPVVKRSFQAPRADMLPLLMRQAHNTMLSGRTGPVHLDVPFNVFVEEAGPAWLDEPEPWTATARRAQADPSDVARAVDVLLEAQRPLILAGHGVLLAEAQSELVELAELLGVPVISTQQGKGGISEDHVLSLGATGRNGAYPANEAARSCDVLLAFGTRFGDRATSAWRPGVTHDFSRQKLLQVDSDPEQLGRNYPPAVAMLGDVKLVLRQLIDVLRGGNSVSGQWDVWRTHACGLKERWNHDLATDRQSDQVPIRPERLIAELQRATPSDAIVLSDIGTLHNWLVQHWQAKAGGLFLQSGGFACMGFGVAGALGAKLAAPDRPVLAVCGDGGFLMHASAIATAVEYHLPAVWVIFNNQGYVSIRDVQSAFFGKDREIATRFRDRTTSELVSADFVALSRSMGAEACRVERPQDLAEQLDVAFASGRPYVLEVMTDPERGPLATGGWDLPPIPGSMPNYGWNSGAVSDRTEDKR